MNVVLNTFNNFKPFPKTNLSNDLTVNENFKDINKIPNTF